MTGDVVSVQSEGHTHTHTGERASISSGLPRVPDVLYYNLHSLPVGEVSMEAERDHLAAATHHLIFSVHFYSIPVHFAMLSLEFSNFPHDGAPT